MNLKNRLLCATAALLIAGCASAGASGGGSHNVLTASEIARVGDVNLYEALNRLRPTFIRDRSMTGTAGTGVKTEPIRVYFDGLQMMEGVEHLKDIAAKNIEEIRLLDPQQANARFGGNNSGGALVITSKK